MLINKVTEAREEQKNELYIFSKKTLEGFNRLFESQQKPLADHMMELTNLMETIEFCQFWVHK